MLTLGWFWDSKPAQISGKVQTGDIPVPATSPLPPRADDRPPPPRPTIHLVGTVSSPGGKDGNAIISLGKQPGITHGLGSEIEGWRITQIEKNQVTLEKAGQRWTLDMEAATNVEIPTVQAEMPLSGREPPPGYPGRIVDGTPGQD